MELEVTTENNMTTEQTLAADEDHDIWLKALEKASEWRNYFVKLEATISKVKNELPHSERVLLWCSCLCFEECYYHIISGNPIVVSGLIIFLLQENKWW